MHMLHGDLGRPRDLIGRLLKLVITVHPVRLEWWRRSVSRFPQRDRRLQDRRAQRLVIGVEQADRVFGDRFQAEEARFALVDGQLLCERSAAGYADIGLQLTGSSLAIETIDSISRAVKRTFKQLPVSSIRSGCK